MPHALKALTLILLLLCSAASAQQFYRWTDENGNVSIQSSIPPEAVSKGYEIIDEKGIVLKVIEPEISEAEKRARETAAVNAEMRRARDEELLKLYRSPADVDRAMKTWLSRMDMEIRVKNNRIRIKENEYNTLQERAANQEKAGQEVSEELLNEMDNIQLEIETYELEIREVELRQEESRSVFLRDRARMVELWEILNNEPWVEPEADD